MKIEKRTFGKADEWVLSGPEAESSVKITPAYGGLIRELTLRGCTIISGPESESALSAVTSFPNAILFPWANRIQDGKYSFSNSFYQLPINEQALNNALHGFVYDKKFNVTNALEEEERCSIQMIYEYDGAFTGYPFPFSLETSIVLSNDHTLTLCFNVTNTGEMAMPFVLGWHPYFKFPNEQVDDWEIHIQAEKEFKLNSQNIPVLSKYCDGAFNSLCLRKKELNQLLLLHADSGDQVLTELFSVSRKQAIRIWQSIGQNQFNYLVIYTPPDRKSIAIEPMSGSINAFNNKEGLITLDAGEQHKLSCWIQLQSFD